MGRRKSTLSPLWDEKGMEMQTTHPRSMKETENQETENQETENQETENQETENQETWKSRK